MSICRSSCAFRWEPPPTATVCECDVRGVPLSPQSLSPAGFVGFGGGRGWVRSKLGRNEDAIRPFSNRLRKAGYTPGIDVANRSRSCPLRSSLTLTGVPMFLRARIERCLRARWLNTTRNLCARYPIVSIEMAWPRRIGMVGPFSQWWVIRCSWWATISLSPTSMNVSHGIRAWCGQQHPHQTQSDRDTVGDPRHHRHGPPGRLHGGCKPPFG